MDLGGLAMFRLLKGRMQWLNARQLVLAQNVANADTPAYQARDLAKPDFRGLLAQETRKARFAVTQAGHLSPPASRAAGMSQPLKTEGDASPSGNTVMLEQEMLKTAETAADHEFLTSLYSKQLGLLRTALGRAPR